MHISFFLVLLFTKVHFRTCTLLLWCKKLNQDFHLSTECEYFWDLWWPAAWHGVLFLRRHSPSSSPARRQSRRAPFEGTSEKDEPPFSLPNTWQSRARGALLPSGSELSSQAWTDTRAGKRARFKACLYTCVCAITSGSWKEIFLFSFYCRSRGGKVKPITARSLLPFNNQGCQSGDNFMLTVWSRSLGGCGGELWKKIFPAVSASVFPDDNTSPNFSWAIILNSCSSRHKK